jgi:hypothetical protein
MGLVGFEDWEWPSVVASAEFFLSFYICTNFFAKIIAHKKNLQK